MELILLQGFMTLANLICVAWMYDRKNYKTAVFNGFVAGICFMGLLNAL
jgi:hypothetical protein